MQVSSTELKGLPAKENSDYATGEGGGWRSAERSGAKCGGDRGGDAQGVTGCRGLEITAGQAILSVQEQKDDPPRRITRDAPRCPVKLIREMLFNGNVTVNTVVLRISGGSAAEIFDAI